MYKNWFCFFQMVDNFIHWMNPYEVDGPVIVKKSSPKNLSADSLPTG